METMTISSRGRVRRRILQTGWTLGFAAVAGTFVAALLGPWQLWVLVAALAAGAALAVVVAPGVEPQEVGDEGPRILLRPVAGSVPLRRAA